MCSACFWSLSCLSCQSVLCSDSQAMLEPNRLYTPWGCLWTVRVKGKVEQNFKSSAAQDDLTCLFHGLGPGKGKFMGTGQNDRRSQDVQAMVLCNWGKAPSEENDKHGDSQMVPKIMFLLLSGRLQFNLLCEPVDLFSFPPTSNSHLVYTISSLGLLFNFFPLG